MRLAKLSQPRTTRAVSRPRIFRLLDRGRDAAITWVCAPPGSGKTTAVASYLAARRVQTQWYQIDADDADIGTFFHYLSQAAPARRHELPQFTLQDRDSIESFARRYFRDLHTRYKTPVVLVLDNYQEAPLDSLLHRVLSVAAGELPEGARIIVISRAEPPAELARLTAHAAIVRIEWEQLKFTTSEAQQLANAAQGKRLPAKTIEALKLKTDGWAAGLTLLLEQSRRDGDVTYDFGTRSREVLFDYFATELFAGLPAATRRTLLEISFMPSATASSAVELTQSPTAGQILEQLHRENFFTSKQGSRNAEYQLHPLFREFLQARALQTLSTERVREIRMAAAKAADARGEFEMSMTLLHDANAIPDMIALLVRWSPVLLDQWRTRTFFYWIGVLPHEIVNSTPWLLYWRGRFGTVQSYEQCLADSERALALFRAEGNIAGMYLAWALSVFAHTYGLRGLENQNAIAEFDELQRIEREMPSPEIDTLVCLAAVIAANAARRPFAEAEYWADRAMRLAAKTANTSVLLHTAPLCVLQYFANGQMQKATALMERMRALANDKNVESNYKLSATMGILWYEAFLALPSYRESAAHAFAAVQATELHTSTSFGALCAGAWAALTDGQLELAAPWLAVLDENLKSWGALESDAQILRAEYRSGMGAWSRWLRVLEALQRGDARSAQRLLPQLQGLRGKTWVWDWATVLLLSAETYLSLADNERALGFLDDAQRYAREVRTPYVDFMTALTAAHVQLACHQDVLGMQSLREGMKLGREHGFVSSHVWQPSVMAMLCARSLAENIERDYVLDLIRHRHLRAPATALAASWPWPIKIYTLGRFGVVLDGRPLEFAGRVQRRPLDLLQIIIAFGARDVACNAVIDSLWPDAEADAAEDALAKALRRLRSILGDHDAIILQDNKLSIDTSVVWIDKLELERALSLPMEEIDVDQIGRLYKGDFLAKEFDANWLLSGRERLRNVVLTTILRKGKLFMQQHRYEQAVGLFERGIDIDPLAEEFYCNLMRCHLALKQSTEGLAVYRRCQNQLAASLRVSPAPETETVQRALRNSAA